MARPRTFDKEAALEAAMMVFWSKGYEATSLDDLEKAMGLRRTSIYNAFGNKRELFQEALGLYSDQVLTGWITGLNSNDDVRSGIEGLFDEALELHFGTNNPGGCLIGLTTMEAESHDEATLQIVAEYFRRLNKGVEDYLRRAKKRGALADTFDEKGVAAVVATVIPGLIMSARGHTRKAVLARAIDTTMQLI